MSLRHASHRLHIGGLVLVSCAVLLSACGRKSEAQAQAEAIAAGQPVEPPIPCAIVSGPEDSRTISQTEVVDGRVVRVVTLAERREGRIIWQHELSYDEAGQLASIDKTISGDDVSLGMRAQTQFQYNDDGRLESSTYKDMAGRVHSQRWIYAGDQTRPEALEIAVNDEVVERLGFDYEGAPVWTKPVFLPRAQFGALRSSSSLGESETLISTMSFDPTTGALLQVKHESGETELFLYGDACADPT